MGNLVKKDVAQEKKNFTEVEKAIEKTYEVMKEFVPKDKAFRAFTATVIASDPEKHAVSDPAGLSRTQICEEIERKLRKEGHWIELKVIKQMMEKQLMELGPIFVGKELVTGSLLEPRGDDAYLRRYLRYDPEKVMLYLNFN